MADLPNLNVLSLCAATVFYGKYAEQILQTVGVTFPETKVTRGQEVTTTLAAVTTGDADAATVYVIDGKRAGNAVTTVALLDAQNAIAVYPIATIKASTSRVDSQAFIAWARVLGGFGARITFAANIRGRTRTVPLAVYLLLESRPEVAFA